MNESQTKHDLISPALKAAGWEVVPGSRLRLEFPITKGRLIGQGRRAKPLFADYVLFYKNRMIGIVEAKKRDSYYTDGVGQAKDYAERLNIRFAYATNGLQIYGIDLEEGTEGEVAKFPTPDALWEMTYPTPKEAYKIEISKWKERLFAIPFEDRGGSWQPRYYQQNAIAKVLESIAEKKDRILLTLATGTGKTAIAFQIAWKLFHAKWNLRRDGTRSPRILFLADRNILADQAYSSFMAFGEDAMERIRPSEIRKTGKVPKNRSIFFTIFQTFMTNSNQEELGEEAEIGEERLETAVGEAKKKYDSADFNFGEYPKDFFDLIIIDECHRGGANDESSWRNIMDYFSPAVQLGLTATPKRDVNGDTYDYFGEPVYSYKLKDGINDGFLTPFKVKEIATTGDNYTYTSDDTVLAGEVDESREYGLEEQNRLIELMDVEQYRVQLFMDIINQSQKSLVFCATQAHAAAVRDLINQFATSKSTNYCHRVTDNDGKLGEQHLRDFQDNEKSIPTILTTSQKLSTGVDAPEIRNIVLMRPVNSMVEFKQIVGRGTRLFDGKDYFTIFDFVKAHQHFKDPDWDGEPQDPEPPILVNPKICGVCGETPCVCEKSEPEDCPVCHQTPCVCKTPPRQMIRIKLSDNKIREIDSMIKTTFWSPTGKPISHTEFLQQLYNDLPTFFSSEEELRKLWSLPSTRKKLLTELHEKGYTNNQLEDLRNLIHGNDSDLFDVLSYVAYHKGLVPRLERASRAKIHLNDYDKKQQEFLNFVLEQYVKTGVDELDMEKLSPLLHLKYNSITDAKNELGDIKSIKESFEGFQGYLYQEKAV